MKGESTSLFIDSMSLKDDGVVLNENALKERLLKNEEEIRSLLFRLNELRKENKGLKALVSDDKIPPLALEKRETIGDSAADKASFLLSLFSPRTDVYATRRYNKELSKASYFPKCFNFWKDGCLRKSGEKGRDTCGLCDLKKYDELTYEKIIRGNFLNTDENGSGAIGVYPLKDGNVTRFVAIDLDEGKWQRDAAFILSTARRAGISMIEERSFSGNGAHLWILFSEDVSAKNARRLAFAVIDKAREEHSGMSLSSYDRLFPSQDSLSDGGIGNLILLPLVASAAVRGSTLFLDEDGNPYPPDKQLDYLASVHRHTEEELNDLISTLTSSYLAEDNFILSDDDINPGWNRRIPKISSSDINGELILYLSSGISFDKLVMSSKMQEALRRFATISNPEYYKNLSRGDGYTKVPSRIPLYEENERVLKLPRGLLQGIKKLLDMRDIKYRIEDHRICKTGLDVSFNGVLRIEQDAALKQMLNNDIGILSTATGFGKTVVALSLIASRKERAMIIVSSEALLSQWEDAANSFLDIRTIPSAARKRKELNPSIGVLSGSKKRISSVVDIVMLQSLASAMERGNFDFALSYGMVIVDECHHIAAEKSRFVLSRLNAKYVYGLSATVKRRDGLERIVYSECGNIIYSYDAAKLSYERGIKQQYITRFLGTNIAKVNKFTSFSMILDELSNDEERNKQIASDIASAYEKGRKIIVFTRRLSQNNSIGNVLKELMIPHVLLDGEKSKSIIKRTLSDLRVKSNPEVLISTDMLLGEGVDIPNLDTLFLSSPYMQERVIQQCAGRLSRSAEGKESTLIYDYVDYRIPRLSYMYTKRLSIYRKLGFIPLSDDKMPYEKLLYDDSDFLDSLLSDIIKATDEIILSTSFLLPSFVTKKIFKGLLAKSSSLRVILYGRSNLNAKIEIENEKLIKENGINYVSVDTPRNFVVIDKCISWYGEMNILGQSKANGNEHKSILRIIDSETAKCLTEGYTELL